MRRHITREECDTPDEVCVLLNEALQERANLAVRIESLEQRIDKQAKRLQEPQVKTKKGGAQ